MYQWNANYGYYDNNGYYYHVPDSQSGPLVATLACPPAIIADISDQVTTLVHPNQQLKMEPANQNRPTVLKLNTSAHIIKTDDPVTKAVVDNIVGNLPLKKPQAKLSCDICNIQVIGQSIMDEHLAGVKHARKIKSVELMKEMKNMITDSSNGCLDLKNSTYTCQACNVIVNSIQQLQVHCQGSKHKSKLTSENGTVINGEIQKVTASSTMPGNAASNAAICLYEQLISSSGDAMSNRFYCSTCNVRVNSVTQLEQHKMSKKHTGRLEGHVDLNTRTVPYSKPPRKMFVKEGWDATPIYTSNSEYIGESLRCNVCNVSANSVIQLQQHNVSRKHLEKLGDQPNEHMETNQQHSYQQTPPSLLKRPWVSPQNEINSYSYSSPVNSNGGGGGYNVNIYQKWSAPSYQRSQPSGYGRY